MPARPGAAPALVGRTEELHALQDAFDAAAEGLVVVLIGGDPGVGKTALARAFVEQQRSAGVPVHWGSCVEIGGAPAFWPWFQVVRSLGDDALAQAAEGLAARADEPFPACHAVHEQLRLRSDVPRIVVLDDLHAADLPSLQLLRYLVASGRQLPVLIIGTHRRHELRGDRTRDALLAAAAEGGRRLVPSTLGLEEVEALLGEQPGDQEGVAAEVLTRSGGNALFVEQLVDAVRRRGAAGLEGLPDGIRAAVRARLAPLPDRTRALLASASVLGPRFRPEVLAAVHGAPVAEVRADLAAASAAGIVAPAEDELTFTHALIRDTLDDELDPLDRRRAHAAAATALAGRADTVPPAVIAQHLLDAGDEAEAGEAARWATAAAAAARRISGHREAGRWAEVAAVHWGLAGAPDRQGALLAEAIADRVTVGDGRRALELAEELAELARTTGSGHLLATAALARAEVFEPMQELDGPPLLREALAHADLGDEPGLRADLLGGLATLLGMPSVAGPRRDGAGARAAVAALADLAASGDPRSRGRLAEARLNVDSGPLHHHDRVRWLTELRELLPPGANVLGRIQQAYWATSLAFEAGDLPAVDRHLREWEALADRSDSTFWTWRAAMARASLAYARGDLAGAEELARSRAELVTSLHPEMAFRVVTGLLFTIRRDQGRLAEVVASLGGADLGELGVLVAVERGDRADVRRRLAPVEAAMAATGPDDLAWLCLASLVAVAVDALGDVERGRRLAEQLEPFADQCVMWGRSYVFGLPVNEAIGLARRGAGEPAEAAEAFRRALDWAEQVGARGAAARARVGLASVLPVDHPDRAELARAARDAALTLGMAPVAAAADGLLATADGPPPAAPSAPPVTAQVRTLGRFEVTGAGRSTVAHWSSRKARDTLKVLISRRGRAIAREELIDVLWPDVDVATGRSRLSVVLSLLRSALDPDRVLPSDPLTADRQSVALDLALVSVDVEDLLGAAADGLGRGSAAEPDRRALGRAARLADAGPFLAEDPYSEFATPLRSTVDRTRADVYRALARICQEEGDGPAAVTWAARLHELDPHDPLALALLPGSRMAGA